MGYVALIVIIAGVIVTSQALDLADLLNLKLQAANFVVGKAISVIHVKQDLVDNSLKGVLTAKQNVLQNQLPRLIEYKTKSVNSILELKKNFLKKKAAQLGNIHVNSSPIVLEEPASPASLGPYEPEVSTHSSSGIPSTPQEFYGPPTAAQPFYKPPAAPQPSYGPPEHPYRRAATPPRLPTSLPEKSKQYSHKASGLFSHLEFATPPPTPNHFHSSRRYHW